MDKNPKLVSIEGKRKEHEKVCDDSAVLMLNGETIHLDSFVLSGEDSGGKRVLLTQNASIDELIAYSKIIEFIVNEKIKETIFDG